MVFGFGPNSSRPTGSFRQGQNRKNQGQDNSRCTAEFQSIAGVDRRRGSETGAKSEHQSGPNQVDKRNQAIYRKIGALTTPFGIFPDSAFCLRS